MARTKTKPSVVAKKDDSNPLLPVLSAGADEIVGTASHDEDVFGPSDIISREARLFSAIIARAILDAELMNPAELRDIGFRNGRESSMGQEAREKLRSEARRWCVSTLDPWREDRIFVCDLAGIDPESFWKICRRRLDILTGKIAEGGNVLPFDKRLVRFVAAMVDQEAA